MMRPDDGAAANHFVAPNEAVIGIDVGGTKAHAVLYSAAGAIASSRRATDVTGLPGLLATLRAVVDDVVRAPEAGQYGIRRQRDISRIGIGIPGIVSSQAGTVSHAVNVGLPEADVPLAHLASAEFGVPVTLTHDVTAATLGSARLMGVDDDVALISLGTGLAVGLILDGTPRHGLLGSAGEIGHIPYVADGPECPCGQRGCLELYASGQALNRLWGGDPSGASKPAEHLLACAARGDEDALAARSIWIGAVAHAVTTVGLTLDVATILMGGGVAGAGEPLVEVLRAELRRRAQGSAFLNRMDLADRVELVPPELDVAPLGAALIAIDS